MDVSRLLNGEEELLKCTLLSSLANQKYYNSIYQEKLEKEREIKTRGSV